MKVDPAEGAAILGRHEVLTFTDDGNVKEELGAVLGVGGEGGQGMDKRLGLERVWLQGCRVGVFPSKGTKVSEGGAEEAAFSVEVQLGRALAED